jgi:iron(III) transport system permease protein
MTVDAPSAPAAAGALPGDGRPRTSYRAIGSRACLLVFVAVLAYLVVVPVVRLQALAFGHGAQGYRDAYTAAGIGTTIITTIELAVGSLCIALVLGTWLAFAAMRLHRRLLFLRIFPVLPIVVPSVASIMGWEFLLSPSPGYLNQVLRHLPWWSHQLSGPVDIYSLPWIVIVTGLGLTSFVYLFITAGLRNINAEVIDAARVHGSSFRTLALIKLPLLRPALLYGGGVALLLGLGQFTGPLLLGTNQGITVVTTSMYVAANQAPPAYAAASALGAPLLLVGVAVVVIQKIGLGDHARFVTRTGRSTSAVLQPSWAAATGIILFSVVSTVLPVIGLALVSLSSFWSGHISLHELTLANFRQAFATPAIIASIQTSLIASIISVLIALPVGYAAAVVLTHRKRHAIAAWLIDIMVTMPLGVPAVIFGVGFLVTYTQQPLILYGTRWIIILVYITLMLPFTTRTQLSAMVALGDSPSEASRVSGAGALRTHLRITVPLMRSTIGGAAALMFVLLTHEFAASLLVRSATTQVMGTELYDYYDSGSYPLVACIALIMTAITTLGVTTALAIGGADVFGEL